MFVKIVPKTDLTAVAIMSITLLLIPYLLITIAMPPEERQNRAEFIEDEILLDVRTSDLSRADNVSSNDTEPPKAEAGTYPPIYQGRTITFNASGSTDDVSGLLENGTFNWSFDHGAPVHLQGVTVSFRFAIPGTYEIRLNVTDAAGNNDTDLTELTVIKDEKPPEIVESYPKNEESEVPLDAELYILFNETLERETIDGNVSLSMVFSQREEKDIEFERRLSDNDTLLTIFPLVRLKKDKIYKISITSNVTDLAGQPLREYTEISFSTIRTFKVLNSKKTPPIPYGGDMVNLTLTFNNKVDLTTVTPDTIEITDPGGKIPIYIHPGGDGRSVVVSMVKPVKYSTTYILNVTGEIRDVNGTKLNTSVWSRQIIRTRGSLPQENGDPIPTFIIFLSALTVLLVTFLSYALIERIVLSRKREYREIKKELGLRKKRAKLREPPKRSKWKGVQKRKEKRGDRDGREPRGRREGRSASSREREMRYGVVRYYDPEDAATFRGNTYEAGGVSSRRVRKPTRSESSRYARERGTDRGKRRGSRRRKEGSDIHFDDREYDLYDRGGYYRPRERPPRRRRGNDSIEWG